ncbi:ABC transporter permease [Phocaeicola sp.]
MLKLIIKSLWARRRRNSWLLAELVLVSIVTWVILDPVIVVMHDRNIPLGYDADRLCMVSLAALQPQAPGYDAHQAQDSTVLMNNYLNLVRRVKDYPGVECSTPILGYCYPCSPGNGNSSLFSEGDSVSRSAMWIEFLPHTQFFETYGFRPGKGMTPEELSDYNYTQNDRVFTENMAEAFFNTTDVRGKRCWSGRGENDTIYYPVVGTVGTFKIYSDWRPVSVMFTPLLSINVGDIPQYAHILVRLKKEVGMNRFLHDFHPWMVKEMRAGNLFARDVQPYSELIAVREYHGVTAVYRRNLAMAAFFLINLGLGVIGTFWLQTRTRREEVGVILSFGGTPGHIVRLLLGEGVVLTLLATLTGCLLYLQYAVKEGLYNGNSWVETTEAYWVTNFTPHFFIVSSIVFLILLVVVMTGIYIPARKISRIPPTEALRDE